MTGRGCAIWHYFDKSNAKDRLAVCRYCHRERSYRTTVSNLKSHLKHKHLSAYNEYLTFFKNKGLSENKIEAPMIIEGIVKEEIVDEDIVKEEIVDEENIKEELPEEESLMEDLPEDEFLEEELLEEDSDGANENSQIENYDSINESPIKIEKIMQVYIPEKKDKLDTKKRVDLSLLKMIICDFQPFSIVDDIGFRAYTHALNPNYEIPDQKTLATHLLPELYEKRLEEVKTFIRSNAKSVCITVECWTSRSMEYYMIITAHFLIENPIELKSMLIHCAEFESRQNGLNIYKKIQKILYTWDIYDKVNLLVTDNASNMDVAAKYFALSGWLHFRCLAHKMNIIIQDALEEIKDTLANVQRVVSYINSNIIAKEKFNLIQTNQQNVLQPKMLIKSDPTRWNTVFLMLERFVELQEALRGTIAFLRADLPLIPMKDWQVLEQIVFILKPFHDATKEMSAEKYLTASKAMVLTKSLIKICENYTYLDELHTPVKLLAHKLKEGMIIRLGNLEENVAISLSTALDPRFKLKPIKDLRNIECLKTELKTKLIDVISKQSQQQPNVCFDKKESEPSTSDASYNMPTYSLWGEFDAETNYDFEPKSVDDQAAEELNQYLELSIIKRSESPLKWWHEYKRIFPNLFKLFLQYGNIMTTSVSCEDIFSEHGPIISDRKTRLPPTKVAELVFLNANKMET